MGIDLSRLRRGNDHDRRPWHGAAFIVEGDLCSWCFSLRRLP